MGFARTILASLLLGLLFLMASGCTEKDATLPQGRLTSLFSTEANATVVSAQADELPIDRPPVGVIVSFNTARERELYAKNHLYFGLLHGHTGVSDGQGMPIEAFEYGRRVGGLNFMAVTDHSDTWLLTGRRDWDSTGSAAALVATDDFLALRGFEYTHHLEGHFVVLGSDDYRVAATDRFNLQRFYTWLAEAPEKSRIAIFAHPGFHKFRYDREFEHFELASLPVQQRIVALETLHWNLNNPLESGFAGIDGVTYFDEALQKGWQLASVASQDNHRPDWGTNDSLRTGVWAEGLDEEALIAALLARRTYATKGPTLELGFQLTNEDGQIAILGDEFDSQRLGADFNVSVYWRAQDARERPVYVEFIGASGLLAGGPLTSSLDIHIGAKHAYEGVALATIPRRIALQAGPLGSGLFIYTRLYDAQGRILAISSPIFLI